MDVKELGAHMRAKRLGEGKSLRTVSRFLGLDPAVVSRFERGLRSPKKSTLQKICDYLGFNMEMVDIVKVPQFSLRTPADEREVITVQCDRCLARKKIVV